MKVEKNKLGKPYVPPMKLEEYSELFKDFFKFKRENGILEVRAHTNDGPIIWREAYHQVLGEIAQYIGKDRENEVIILTGSDDKFIGGLDPDAIKADLADAVNEDSNIADVLNAQFDKWYSGRKVMESWVWDIHVPVIGALNGTTMGGSTWFFTLLDMFLCADDVMFNEAHFKGGNVPGDGNWTMLSKRMGGNRANYTAYTGKAITAQQALELGIVNEVLPNGKVLDRAWEMAREIMQQPRHIRHMTHELMRQRNLKDLSDHFMADTSVQWWGMSLLFATKTSNLHNIEDILEKMKSDNK